MALIRDADAEWSASVTLDSDEIWQARSGCVFLSTTPSPEPDDGFQLVPGRAVLLSAGRQVSYRTLVPAQTVIVREKV